MSITQSASADLQSAVSKFFRRVVPLLIIMLICNQLNRANIGYAQEYLEADVGIGAAAYGFGAGVFFVAYALFELPSNILMEKFGARIWLTRIMISWGLVSAAMMFVRSAEMFYMLRFLLGMAEAGFFPAVIYYMAKWLPDSHRGRATALFIAGSSIAAAISGPLSGPLLSLHGQGGLRGWQWLFLIEGMVSVLVGVVAYFMLNSKIRDARWLTRAEQDALIDAIEVEEAEKTRASGVEGKGNRWKMLADPKLLLFCWIYFAIQLSIYANTFWLPSIVRRIDGLNDITVGLLSSLPWISAVIAMYLSSRLGDRRPDLRRSPADLRPPHGRRRNLPRGHHLATAGSPVPVHRGDGLQERQPPVLVNPPVLHAPTGIGTRDRDHQLAGQSRRVRRAVRVRPDQTSHRHRHLGPVCAGRRQPDRCRFRHARAEEVGRRHRLLLPRAGPGRQDLALSSGRSPNGLPPPRCPPRHGPR